ncbi:MAG TPA: solute carrier family 23 protein, partial [Burkholderiaceae bacterium]|nr:solute carrier family 23 protein [Burkholderiaceae bacterium]
MGEPANASWWGPADSPPKALVLLSALQHIVAATTLLTYPLLVAQAAGASSATTASFISLTLLAAGAGTLLQAFRLGPVGSGYLCWPNATVLYLLPSLVAAEMGGIPLVLGMTLAAALFEIALAPMMRRLRPLFPPEIAGVIVLLVGITSGAIGVRMIAGALPDTASGAALPPIAVALFALAVMTALNVWTTGVWRIGCVLVGTVAGMLVAARVGGNGGLAWPAFGGSSGGPTFALPDLSHLGWSFDATLLIPFTIGGLAAAIKTSGSVVILQSACDPRWVRADMRSVGGGVLADGLGTGLAAAIGGLGLNASSVAAGLAAATGMHSRRVAVAIAAICVLLGLFPAIGLFLTRMPAELLGATLVFSSVYLIVNGVQIVTSRMLDARRTFVVGLGLLAGLSVELAPA